MVYAPVVVHTLNRFEHFKRCVESLKENTYAQYTDFFISVDYPPEKKYEEGYNKIVEYLQDNEMSLKECFHEVHVFYQKENLGARLNATFLRDYVENDGRYDRYIFAEDDIEFAPCFLEYMDKGLEMFKDDEDVLAIIATSDINNGVIGEYNTHKSVISGSWGIGRWFEKEKEFRKNFNRELFENISKDFRMMYKLFCMSQSVFLAFYNTLLRRSETYVLADGSPRSVDLNRYIYNIIYAKCVIRPYISMVRNWGMDGSGINSGNTGINALEQHIYDGKQFDLKVEQKVYYPSKTKITLKEYVSFLKKVAGIYLYNIIGEKNFRKLDFDMMGAKVHHKIYKIKKVFKKNI